MSNTTTKFTAVIFLLACQLASVAQLKKLEDVNSYYLGKRDAAGISFLLYPTTFPTRFSENMASADESNLGFIASPEIYFTRATNNTSSVQFSFSRARLHGFNQELTNPSADRSTIWRGEVGNMVYGKTSFGFHINKHFANRGNLSPIGNHFKYGFRLNSFRNRFNGITLPTIQGDAPDYDLTQKELTMIYISIDLGYTYRSMISKNIYFDMSVLGGFPLRISPNLYNESNPEERLNNELFELGAKRLRFSNIGAFGFGIGKIL